ncbi:MAG: hypothetical protein N2Z20_04965 [Elusimicrobiales bacterium]|nr:hypothetical protein [Elusimicrobiales bacterium]
MHIIITLIFCVVAIFLVKYILNIGTDLHSITLAFISMLLVFISFNYPIKSIIFLIYSMLLSPEISLAEIPGRNVVIRYDDIFLIIIFVSWLVRSSLFKSRAFIIKTPIIIPLVVYTSSYFISTFLGVLRGDIFLKKAFFYVLKYSEYFILYILSVNILYNENNLRKFINHAFIVLFIVIIYSFYYYFNSQGDFIRTTAPFEAPLDKPEESEPASLGGYYLIWSFFIISLLSEIKNLKTRIVFFVIIIALYISFLLTFSRASYYGMLVGFLFFLFFVQKRKLFFIWLTIFSIMFSLFLPGIGKKVRDRIKYTYEGEEAVNPVLTPFGVIMLEDSAYARYKSIENVILNVVPYYPIFGKGVTGIGLGDNQYALLLGESGIVGFLSFFWLIFSVVGLSIKVYHTSKDYYERALGLGVFCSTFALLAQGVGVNTFIIVRIMEPYWFFVALVTVIYLRNKNLITKNDRNN